MSPKPTDKTLRNSLIQQLAGARRSTDSLFELLKPEAIHDRPIRQRHRIIFYLGHLEAFDWNLIARTTMGRDPFDEYFDDLFAFGIDPVDEGLPSDSPSDWPAVAEIEAYSRRIRQTVDRFLRNGALDEKTATGLGNGVVFQVAIEHRLMHAETLAYMFHWLPFDRKQPQPEAPEPPDPEVRHQQVEIPAGPATLGIPRDGVSFGWDNEFESTQIDVPAFEIGAYNVTNKQYLKFVEAEGYQDRTIWEEDDWQWIRSRDIRHPQFWRRNGQGWVYRTMFEERPLAMSWPAYVSHAEASAYARWAGASLPSEAQLHRAGYGTPEGSERSFPWGNETPGPAHGNFAFKRWNPTPVGAFPQGNSAFGVADILANGWEWTSTVFQPFEGFERFPFYPGYSADFFDDKHYVMKGGSSRTATCMLRRSFRNWFQTRYPHIYSTFRCVYA